MSSLDEGRGNNSSQISDDECSINTRDNKSNDFDSSVPLTFAAARKDAPTIHMAKISPIWYVKPCFFVTNRLY